MSENAPRRGSILDVVRAVFWSFLGIRRRHAHERDAVTLSPVQVVVAGLIGALIFILALVFVVRMVIAHAT